MTTSFSHSNGFKRELQRINEHVQLIATASNINNLNFSFNYLCGYIDGLMTLVNTNEIDLQAIWYEVWEIKKVRHAELMALDIDDHDKYYSDCSKYFVKEIKSD